MKLTNLAIAIGITFIAIPKINFSQDASKSNSIPKKSTAITAIYALPVGNFAKSDLETGGYSGTGWGIGLKTNNKFYKSLGLVSNNTFSWVKFKTADLAADYSTYLGKKTEVTGGQHRPFFSTYGLGYDFLVGNRLMIGATAQIGLIYNTFKPMDIKVYDASNALIYSDNLHYDSGFGFAYGFSADLTYILIPKLLGFKVSGDFMSGNIKTYLRSDKLDDVKTIEKIQMININFGLIIFTDK